MFDILCAIIDCEKFLLAQDHFLPSSTHHFVIGCQLNGIHGAGLFTHPTKNAPKLVEFEFRRVFLPIRPGRLRRFNVNAVRRTSRRTHETRHTGHATLFIPIQPVNPAIVFNPLISPFFGVLNRHPLAKK